MTDRDSSIPAGHTPQHRPEQEPQPYDAAPQDEGESTEFLEQLAGINPDQTAYIGAEHIERLEGITMTDIYQGDVDVNQERVEGAAESLDMLESRELREGETDDVMEAIEEGYTYVPPVDPPTTIDPGDPETVDMATGTEIDARDPSHPESGLDTAHMDEDDMTALVRRALRDDAATSHLADRLHIVTANGRVIIRGEVDDIDDTDNIVAVISEVPGVEAVQDETIVAGI
jgi:hypothetical protein